MPMSDDKFNRGNHFHNYLNDDYSDDYEDEDAPLYRPGPLSKFPSAGHLRPAVICVILFYFASTLHGTHPYGDLLWVSGEKVFEKQELWRLFTALFVHGSLVHLLSNLFMFMVFGWLLKAYFGFAVFPVISFIIGIIVNLATISFYEPATRLVGASGMIYAMAALWLIFFLRHYTERSFPARLLRVTGFVLVLLIPSTFEPQVSYLAHGLGFMAGTTAGILLLPFAAVRDPG